MNYKFQKTNQSIKVSFFIWIFCNFNKIIDILTIKHVSNDEDIFVIVLTKDKTVIYTKTKYNSLKKKWIMNKKLDFLNLKDENLQFHQTLGGEQLFSLIN